MVRFHIRPANSGDIPVIVDFQMKMASETENITLDRSVLTRGITRLFENSSRGKYFVIEKDREVIGCLMITYEWSDWRDGQVLWIQSVFVRKEFRGQGVYKELYNHIRSLTLADPEMKGIRLYVDRRNLAAREVYGKLGMDGEHYQVYEWMKP